MTFHRDWDQPHYPNDNLPHIMKPSLHFHNTPDGGKIDVCMGGTLSSQMYRSIISCPLAVCVVPVFKDIFSIRLVNH